MDIQKNLTKRYTFPSVNVTEIIRSPVSQNVEWRNTIGIAAPFSKGPKLARITGDRKQVIALFGEDQSVGSLFLQQAMLQGASDFVISRVVPENQAPQGAISFSPTNLNNINNEEPIVNEFGDRTIGLKFKSSLISKFQPSPGTFTGLQTNSITGKNTELEIITNTIDRPAVNLSDINYFDLKGIELVSIPDLESREIISDRLFTILNAEVKTQSVFKIRFTDTATLVGAQTNQINQLIRSIKPGLAIESNNSNLVIGSTNAKLTILSYANEIEPNLFEFLVQGSITTVGAGIPELKVVNPTASADYSYTIVGVQHRSKNLTSLSELLINPNPNYISYIIAPHNSAPGTARNIRYFTEDNAGINLVSTGITVAFGSSVNGGISRTSYKLSGTITTFNTEVEVGEIDSTKGSSLDAFLPGTSVIDIYKELRSALVSSDTFSSLFSEIEINETTLPYSLSFKLENKSTIGNDIQYAVELIKTNPSIANAEDDIKIVIDGVQQTSTLRYQNMVGGEDGLKSADVTLYDNKGNPVLYVQAISPGAAGNSITLSINQSKEGEFTLDVFDTLDNLNSTSLTAERYFLTNISVDTKTGVYPETLTSNYIRAYFIPAIVSESSLSPEVYKQIPNRIAPPDFSLNSTNDVNNPTHPNHRGSVFLQNVRLKGGREPSLYRLTGFPSEDDYIQAINRLKNQDVVLIAAPGINAGDLKYANAVKALVDQANSSTPYEGLRIAVVTTPPRMSVSKARIISSSYNDERVVLLAGHCQFNGLSGRSTKLVSSDGYYAGYLLSLPPHISPAAQLNSGLTGVSSLDISYSLDDLDNITKLNIDALHLDPVTRQYKFLNGRTSNTNLVQQWISIRRHADHLIMNLFSNLQWAKALPNDEELRTRISSACDAFLKYEKSRGYITDFSPTIADESINTPEDLVTGNLNILLRYIPKVPADYINLSVVRDFSAQFTLGLTS